MRLHSIELVPDAAGNEHVRGQWLSLSEAGLPSQADHRGPTNAPHVTVAAMPTITAEHESRAAGLLCPLLPVDVVLGGPVLLGGSRRPVLARVVEVTDALHDVVLGLRDARIGHPHGAWLPHVTLSRGLLPDQVERALDVLDLTETPLRLAGLRRWNPDLGTVTALRAAPGPA